MNDNYEVDFREKKEMTAKNGSTLNNALNNYLFKIEQLNKITYNILCNLKTFEADDYNMDEDKKNDFPVRDYKSQNYSGFSKLKVLDENINDLEIKLEGINNFIIDNIKIG